MKKPLIIAISCLLATAGFTFAQTASFSFNDNNGAPTSGTYSASGTFTLTLAGTFGGLTAGDTAEGYSLWMEAPTALASGLSVTTLSQIQFTDPTQPLLPKVFTDSSGANTGFLSDKQGTLSGDMGATDLDGTQGTSNGTFNLANITFTLNNATPGTYTIFTTSLSPKGSGMSDANFSYFDAPQAAYTITITGVPEPSILSLLALGGLGSVGVALRRRQRA